MQLRDGEYELTVQRVRAALKRAFARELNHDPHRLGALLCYVTRVVKMSRGLTQAQTMFLVDALRDVADEVENRFLG
jgi:hypothetical protein